MGNGQDALQSCGQGPKPSNNLRNDPKRTKKVDSSSSESVSNPNTKNLKDCNLNILTLNVRGIQCNGRLDQVELLLKKYQASLAILTETETNQSYAKTTNLEGFYSFLSSNVCLWPICREGSWGYHDGFQ